MIRVARHGEVVATPSLKTTHSGSTGKWTAGEVTYARHPSLVVDGSAALLRASCTFTFTGHPESHVVVLHLEGESTRLTIDGKPVLLADATDEYDDNRLFVQTASHLRTDR